MAFKIWLRPFKDLGLGQSSLTEILHPRNVPAIFRFKNAAQRLSLYRYTSHSAGTVSSGGGVLNSRLINTRISRISPGKDGRWVLTTFHAQTAASVTKPGELGIMILTAPFASGAIETELPPSKPLIPTTTDVNFHME